MASATGVPARPPGGQGGGREREPLLGPGRGSNGENDPSILRNLTSGKLLLEYVLACRSRRIPGLTIDARNRLHCPVWHRDAHSHCLDKCPHKTIHTIFMAPACPVDWYPPVDAVHTRPAACSLGGAKTRWANYPRQPQLCFISRPRRRRGRY